MAEFEGFLIEGIANGFDGGQAGVVLRGVANASDANIFPTAADSDSALSDGVGDNRAHVVGESGLRYETHIGIFIKTQAMGAKRNASSFALKLIRNRFACSSSLC
jgi:hypothetical protein